MTRRAKALVLLLIAVATCASQGLSMALCRCTGHVFVGAAPESCCGECPEEAGNRDAIQAATPHVHGCLVMTSRDNCFVVVSKGWETYLPTNAKEQAPSPMLTAVEPLASLLLIPPMPRHAPTGLLSWHLTHESDPPGLSRVVLYRSLLI
ncbi:hypothetical protein DES53_101565 [Roseimicrobium gellanilyticum]|uniref:Uncharacterized protein n=2 Tax=Roseimicrobium gellanilyticum TaxID=748857 RepID=A0A366HU05_9BACT|nr:hypothetical protein DES53_101565 [Roseimicrobium gellanilyticum]